MIEAVEAIRDDTLKVNMADEKVFIAYLTMMYQIIVASENLMELISNKPVRASFKNYIYHHKIEETGHAEMLAEDLRRHGVDINIIPPYRLAAELAGSQYYYIAHQSPYALLGYMMVMEGFPMPVQDVEELEVIYGKSLTRTLMLHAHADLQHREVLFTLIDTLTYNEQHIVIMNAVRTQHLLNDIARFLNDSR